MKKWQEYLLWVAFCFILIVPYSLAQTCVEEGISPKWLFIVTAVTIFIIGWMSVFFGIKKLKNKKTKQNKTKKMISGFAYLMLGWSIFMTSDAIVYFLDNNMLNKWYFITIGFVYMFIGWICARLDIFFTKKQK